MSGVDWSIAERLGPVLDRARAVGFLGPGPVDDHITHARRFHEPLVGREQVGLSSVPAGPLADLGSGGGVPGLPLFLADQDRHGALIDASAKRCAFLVWAVTELDLADRVSVWCARAEEVAHEPRGRAQFAAVVARGFGPPAWTVECAGPLLVPDGVLVISEPPEPRSWPADGLARVGLAQRSAPSTVAVFQQVGPVEDGLPRPAKRGQRSPLFDLEDRS
jgi:16S rRNA (guanine527-N7)-methyltransferase